MHRPRKLARALGRKACRPFCRHLPGDLLTGTLPSQRTLRRWLEAGLIFRMIHGYILTPEGARLFGKEDPHGQ